jgi:hypothetical protein
MATPADQTINPLSDTARAIAAPVQRIEHAEDFLTRMVEQQTAKVPSHVFLMAAMGAMFVSLAAELANRQRSSRFIGMWVGPLLTMGVYNKIVKTFGAR